MAGSRVAGPSGAMAMLFVAISLPSCAGRAPESLPVPLEWTTGFWQWSSGPEAVPTRPIDAIYFLVGSITEAEGGQASHWNILGGLPETTPDARERWMVFSRHHAIGARAVLPPGFHSTRASATEPGIDRPQPEEPSWPLPHSARPFSLVPSADDELWAEPAWHRSTRTRPQIEQNLNHPVDVPPITG